MSAIKSILKKDILYLKNWLMIWFGVLMIQILFNMLSVFYFSDHYHVQKYFQVFMSLLAVVQLLLIMIIIPLLIHEDSVIRDDAFWPTRPISPEMLMAAKVRFIGVMIILPIRKLNLSGLRKSRLVLS